MGKDIDKLRRQPVFRQDTRDRAGEAEQRAVVPSGQEINLVDRHDLSDLAAAGMDNLLEFPVGRHRQEQGVDDGVELGEPPDVGIAMGQQINSAVYRFQLADNQGDQPFRDDRAVLRGDEFQRQFFNFTQGVEKDVL